MLTSVIIWAKHLKPDKTKIMKDFFLHLEQISQMLYKLLAGLLAAVLGYCSPIKDFVHLLIFLLVVDMLFGYWANSKTKGENFSFKKVWRVTVPRMLVGITLIVCAYLWDVIYHQVMFETYRVIGWLLSGFTLVSIAQNGYIITNWKALNEIGSVILEKLPMKNIKKQNK